MGRALVVGRFQPVHLGHVHLIKQAREHAGSVVVVIGSSDAKPSLRNPFTFEERAEMLRAAFGDDLEIIGVPDIHNPPRYPAHCMELVGPVTEVFGNDDRTMDLFEDDGHRVFRPGLEHRTEWEAATVRAWLAEGDSAWRRAVPKGVATILDRIEASKRLRSMED